MSEEISKLNNDPINLTTTNGHKVVFRPFAPQRFINERRKLLLKSANMNMGKMIEGNRTGKSSKEIADSSAVFGEISGTVIGDINDLAIKYLVKSIDDKTDEAMIEFYELDMRDVDCHEVLNKVLDIVSETTFEPAEKKA